MGACDSATKVLNTTSAISSATNSILSVKNLLSNKVKFNEMTSDSFDKYDKDKSGYMEEAELKEVINDVAAKLNKATNIDEETVKKVLQTIDTNKDGKISRDEFNALSHEKLVAALN